MMEKVKNRTKKTRAYLIFRMQEPVNVSLKKVVSFFASYMNSDWGGESVLSS
jgi:hypothetical protein